MRPEQPRSLNWITRPSLHSCNACALRYFAACVYSSHIFIFFSPSFLRLFGAQFDDGLVQPSWLESVNCLLRFSFFLSAFRVSIALACPGGPCDFAVLAAITFRFTTVKSSSFLSWCAGWKLHLDVSHRQASSFGSSARYYCPGDR